MGNTYKFSHCLEHKNDRVWNIKPTHKAMIIWHLLAVWYYLSSSFCAGAESSRSFRLVDLTHVFDNNTLYWVTEPSLLLNVTYNGTLPGKNIWYQKDEISAATHGGTHMDAPCHFAKGRWCVSDIPLERLVVPAIVIDISHHVNGDPEVHLTLDMMLEWEEKHGLIPEQSLLLIYTGWSQYWPDRLKYSGTSEKKINLLKFPSIKIEVAEWLIANRSVVGVGIDTMSVDIPNERPGTHVTLMVHNIYGLENVNNLDKLPPTGAMVYVMPMKLKNASGAPCRLIAQIPVEDSNQSGGSSTSLHIMFLIVTLFIAYVLRLLR